MLPFLGLLSCFPGVCWRKLWESPAAYSMTRPLGRQWPWINIPRNHEEALIFPGSSHSAVFYSVRVPNPPDQIQGRVHQFRLFPAPRLPPLADTKGEEVLKVSCFPLRQEFQYWSSWNSYRAEGWLVEVLYSEFVVPIHQLPPMFRGPPMARGL